LPDEVASDHEPGKSRAPQPCYHPQPMHLLIVNQYGLPTGTPGITRHGDLGAELARRGHEVTVIASRFNYLTRSRSDGRTSEDHGGVRFRWLDTGSYRGNDRQRARSMLKFTARATAVGLRLPRRPDVVIASSPHLLVGLSGAAIARRYRVPFLFEVRDLWPSILVDLGAVRAGSIGHRALERLERLTYRLADRIITVPPHADRRVAELGADAAKCVHIPNATALDASVEAPLPSSLADILDRCEGRDVLLYAGAQGVSNGLDVVLDMLDLMRRDDPATYGRLAVVLVGDGGEHDALVASASGRGHDYLFFHAPVEKAAIPAALRRASFLLVSFSDAPTYDYGLSPNKLFDYMSARRPVLLASRLLDTPVDEARAGRCFVPGSPASLADAVRWLVETPAAERAAMGDRGADLVRRRYTIPATADQLEALLMEVTATRG
jgi:glycosyltransferase involved in cell wall biosynthesis